MFPETNTAFSSPRQIYSISRMKYTRMKRGLVVLQEMDLTDELLDEAGTYANATGTELLLLSFISETEYEDDVDALASIGDIENTSYNDDAVLRGVKKEIEKVATAAFDGRLVDYESIVKVAQKTTSMPNARSKWLTSTSVTTFSSSAKNDPRLGKRSLVTRFSSLFSTSTDLSPSR